MRSKKKEDTGISNRQKGLLVGVLLGISLGFLYQLLWGTAEFVFTVTVILSSIVIVLSLYFSGFEGSMVTGIGGGLIISVILGALLFPSYGGL